MFAQGQLLGMQTSMLERLKTEIVGWGSVAERHPYSRYNMRTRRPATSEVFSTAFGGDGLPVRVVDRNRRARVVVEQGHRMKQPYPAGYTGHIAGVRGTDGMTYGRQTRSAINGVRHPRTTREFSSQAAAFVSPDEQVADSLDAARQSDEYLSRPKKRADEAIKTEPLVSSTHLAYKAPPATQYLHPIWTERYTSNCGQPDTYGHFREAAIHRPSTVGIGGTRRGIARSASNGGVHSLTPVSTAAPKERRRPDLLSLPPAGRSSRPDSWIVRTHSKLSHSQRNFCAPSLQPFS